MRLSSCLRDPLFPAEAAAAAAATAPAAPAAAAPGAAALAPAAPAAPAASAPAASAGASRVASGRILFHPGFRRVMPWERRLWKVTFSKDTNRNVFDLEMIVMLR